MPKTFRVTIIPVKGEEKLSGTFIESRSDAFFSPAFPQIEHLRKDMTFHRRWVDAKYTVHITPGCDVMVTVG